MDQKPDVDDRPNARALERAAGAVEFRGVSFRYGKGRPVLDDVSFTIEPGTRLGIVGATGAGKSTLLNLLTRFYDPSVGQVTLDGTDIRDFRLADLRNQYALVLQDAVLFSATIAENAGNARPTPRGKRSSQPRGPPAPTTSSRVSLSPTTPAWANAA